MIFIPSLLLRLLLLLRATHRSYHTSFLLATSSYVPHLRCLKTAQSSSPLHRPQVWPSLEHVGAHNKPRPLSAESDSCVHVLRAEMSYFYSPFLLLAVSRVLLAAADDVLLKPTKQGREEVALIYIQGAQIRPDQYVPLAKAIQAASEYTLWVGIPEFWLDMPQPLDLSGGINRIMKNMTDAGMNATKFFFAGHSLGGAMLQDYIFANKQRASGQILMGSFLERKYRKKTYPVATLTVAGELDGLCRITRIMESFYHQVTHAASDADAKRFPVIVVPGMNHMDIASGDPPSLVKQKDLKSEISEEEAHGILANLTAAFIATQFGGSSQVNIIDEYVTATGKMVQPLMTAFEQEGFYNFKPPCNDNPKSSACTLGSPWVATAQTIMADLPEGKVDNVDTFHPVWQINPIHLPHILQNCSISSASCVVQSVTVTQNVYSMFDTLDTAFFPVSATEMRVKMSSRQAMRQAAGYGVLEFNKTDGGSICQVINQASYKWALDNAGKNALARFNKFGEPMMMGADKGPYNVGPLWIWKALEYKEVTDSAGQKEEEVRSVMMTPLDYPIKLSRGFHYCKLLSPARAMEWIYVDGLRNGDPIHL